MRCVPKRAAVGHCRLIERAIRVLPEFAAQQPIDPGEVPVDSEQLCAVHPQTARELCKPLGGFVGNWNTDRARFRTKLAENPSVFEVASPAQKPSYGSPITTWDGNEDGSYTGSPAPSL